MTNPHGVEILLVEDNPSDAELTLRALKQRNLANHVVVCRDGADAHPALCLCENQLCHV